jgi:hypothetical protein
MPWQHPKFPPRPHGPASPVVYYDTLNKRVCTAATRTVVNGQTRCP